MDKLERMFEKAREDGLWSGAVVQVGDTDRVLYRKVDGQAWPDEGIAMREDSIFDIASVTKVVGTATLIAMLYGDGKVDLDAPFTEYLPEYHGRLFSSITVRQLALHISGFDNSKPYLAVGEGRLLRSAVLETSPAEVPGKRFEYACINYILLGYIIEAVSGERLSVNAEKRFFSVLNMRDTAWGRLANADPARCVKMENVDCRGHISDSTAQLSDRPIGSAGIFSTVGDLAIYCRMMLEQGDAILSARGYQALSSDCMPSFIGHSHSIGWEMQAEFRPECFSDGTIYHSGWTGQTVWIDPEKQRYVIVLTNRTGDWQEAKERRLQLANAVLSGL